MLNTYMAHVQWQAMIAREHKISKECADLDLTNRKEHHLIYANDQFHCITMGAPPLNTRSNDKSYKPRQSLMGRIWTNKGDYLH